MRKNALVSIHLSSGRSIDGSYKRTDRKYVYVREHSVEVDGVMRRLESETLLVPRKNIEFIEVHK